MAGVYLLKKQITLSAECLPRITSYSLKERKKTLNPFFMIICRGAWTVCCGTTEGPTTGFKVSKPPQIKLNIVAL